ncbi:MAG TPA: EamA family transporter [Hyphomicrobiaceae bacterium]|nr:EamA family transporter [Hyphomicrobiaceae bacterium]
MVFLAVVLAAIMHAGWNAVIKGGGDPFATLTHMSMMNAVISLAVIPFVPWPRPETWAWLVASVVIHSAYRLLLINAYRLGDLTHVYPIARGAAPLVTAIATFALIAETIAPTGYIAIALLSLGVVLMSLKGGRLGNLDGKVTGFALLSAASTSAYTLVDGLGARANGSGIGFAVWMFFLNALAMQVIAGFWRGPAVWTSVAGAWRPALAGSALSMGAYAIVIWAMTLAPIALVASLRETSVLFAALIGIIVLGEPVTRWRILAALAIGAGMVLIKAS